MHLYARSGSCPLLTVRLSAPMAASQHCSRSASAQKKTRAENERYCLADLSALAGFCLLQLRSIFLLVHRDSFPHLHRHHIRVPMAMIVLTREPLHSGPYAPIRSATYCRTGITTKVIGVFRFQVTTGMVIAFHSIGQTASIPFTSGNSSPRRKVKATLP